MTPTSEKIVDMIIDVLLKHVSKGTLLKTIRELEEIRGDRNFRETIQRLSERVQSGGGKKG